jgi:hypothetical protein
VLGGGDVNGGGPGAARCAEPELGPARGMGVRARFAGLELSLGGDPALLALWSRVATGRSSAPRGDRPASSRPDRLPPGALTLHCELEGVPRGPALPPLAALPAQPVSAAQGLAWHWDEPRGRVLSPSGEAFVEREPGGFRAHVRVAREARAARLLLVGLASLLVHLRGGVALHAASVELDGGALAFIGPSGAGKSTACDHVRGAEPFAVDRLVLLPAPTGSATPWLAHPLPGGSPRPGELGSAPRWLPLCAVLRVHPSSSGSRFEPCPAALAVLLARESAFQLGSGPEPERALLATLERLGREVSIARLHVQLGQDLTPLLRTRLALAERELA